MIGYSRPSTQIAYWGIYDIWDKRIVTLQYKEREQAEQLLEFMNNRGKEKYMLRVFKQTITELPAQLIMVIVNDVRINGITENKKTGERRFWLKLFHELETTTYTETKHLFKETFKSHRHKGELRVIKGDLRYTYDEFETYAKKRWPVGWENVMIRLDG